MKIVHIKHFLNDLILWFQTEKTNHLVDKIVNTSTKLSSVTASALLKNSYIKVSKSSICDLLKKIPCLRSVIFSNS